MQQFVQSVFLALQNIRANPLHTFLSTLGIIIGVAALVGILALGDGLEKTGREQLANTTSLNIITVSSKRTKVIDDVRIQINDRPKLSIDQIRSLSSTINESGIIDYTIRQTAQLSYKDSLAGTYLQGSLESAIELISESVEYGRYLSEDDIRENKQVAVLSYFLADKLSPEPESLIGKSVSLKDRSFEIIGILSETDFEVPNVYVPISIFLSEPETYPNIVIKANNAEDIPEIENNIKAWLDNNFEKGSDAFQVSSNRMRVEQFSQGILLFKLIMGAITGISVLVGGIGVMNVLLISVTERTKEIGIRKAAGAKRKDIVLQFLAESVTVSFIGCILGWIVGIAGIFIFVPIVNSLADIGQFQAAISAGTVIVILLIALFVGILFGTYPAWRAANLTPVDAIRHE